MAITGTTTAYSQVAIGDQVNCNISRPNAAVLSAASTDAIGAGYGVDLLSTAIGGYRELVGLPSSAAGIFHGIVPRRAIPTAEEAALRGSTADQLYPSQCLQVYDHGAWRVPIVENVTAMGAAYLVFSGANAGKFGASDGGTQPVYLLEITSTGAGAIGFTATAGGVTGADLTTTSVSAAADSAFLANAWNASGFYSQFGTAVVGGTDDVTITGNALTALTFTDTSAGGNAVADSVTTPLVAATARLIPGARWDVTTTGASGAGVLNLGDN